MAKAGGILKPWVVAWRSLRRESGMRCGSCGGLPPRGAWWPVRGRVHGVHLRGVWYCTPDCLHRGLSEVLEREQPGQRRQGVAAHRVPLGLLLLSRQELTAVQLRTALEVQRGAGEGRIGDWLRQLGFASEAQITAALARQWACPVLKTGPAVLAAGRFLPIPTLLLECFQMIPAGFVESTQTLLMAFSEGIDHTVLYAVEQMLQYRTQACFVCPSVLQKGLRELVERDAAKDVVFDRLEDMSECARVTVSYTSRIGAEEVRLAHCGSHIWVRLQAERREAVNLVLRTPGAAAWNPGIRPFRQERAAV
ncbi:MAG: hypothetical protein WAL56_02950 [Candidatus Sulfotelmatobacter sp.]